MGFSVFSFVGWVGEFGRLFMGEGGVIDGVTFKSCPE